MGDGGVIAKVISIHAPLTGSDMIYRKKNCVHVISIHAPLTGSDQTGWRSWKPRAYFNPRSPYGERQQDCTKFYLGFCLSSTIL